MNYVLGEVIKLMTRDFEALHKLTSYAMEAGCTFIFPICAKEATVTEEPSYQLAVFKTIGRTLLENSMKGDN